MMIKYEVLPAADFNMELKAQRQWRSRCGLKCERASKRQQASAAADVVPTCA